MKPAKFDGAEKPDKPRSVAGMQVLSDIRGLISGTRDAAKPAAGAKEGKDASSAQIARLQKEIASWKELAQKRQEELDRLRSERDALTASLTVTAPGKDKASRPDRADQRLSDEISDLEQRKAGLSSVLSDVEGLLQIKTQDLLRRLANLYEESGQSDFAQELRRGRSGLQDPDSLASFLRALLRQ